MCLCDAPTVVGGSQKQPGFRAQASRGEFSVERPSGCVTLARSLAFSEPHSFIQSTSITCSLAVWLPLGRQGQTRQRESNPSCSCWSHLSFPIFKVGVTIPTFQIVSVKHRASGLSALWRFVFFLVLETLELHPSFQGTQLSAGGNGSQGAPFRARSSSQMALVLPCWHGPWE